MTATTFGGGTGKKCRREFQKKKDKSYRVYCFKSRSPKSREILFGTFKIF